MTPKKLHTAMSASEIVRRSHEGPIAIEEPKHCFEALPFAFPWS